MNKDNTEQPVRTLHKVPYGKKEVTVDEVAPGVGRRASRKGATSYLVKCSITGDWCYTSSERMDKLVQRYGSIEEVGQKYTSRVGKRQIKEAAADVIKVDGLVAVETITLTEEE